MTLGKARRQSLPQYSLFWEAGRWFPLRASESDRLANFCVGKRLSGEWQSTHRVLQRLTDLGQTPSSSSSTSRHHPHADWLIDLGPEGRRKDGGAACVAQGHPRTGLKSHKSPTPGTKPSPNISIQRRRKNNPWARTGALA